MSTGGSNGGTPSGGWAGDSVLCFLGSWQERGKQLVIRAENSNDALPRAFDLSCHRQLGEESLGLKPDLPSFQERDPSAAGSDQTRTEQNCAWLNTRPMESISFQQLFQM